MVRGMVYKAAGGVTSARHLACMIVIITSFMALACRSGGGVKPDPSSSSLAEVDGAAADSPAAKQDPTEALVNTRWRHEESFAEKSEAVEMKFDMRLEHVYARDGVFMSELDLTVTIPWSQTDITLTSTTGASVPLGDMETRLRFASLGDWTMQGREVTHTGQRYGLVERSEETLAGEPIEVFLRKRDVDRSDPRNAQIIEAMSLIASGLETSITGETAAAETWTLDSVDESQLIATDAQGETSRYEAISRLSEKGVAELRAETKALLAQQHEGAGAL